MRKRSILCMAFVCTLFQLSAQCDVDFGSTVGTLTFSAGDIVNGATGGGNEKDTLAFDIWDEANLDCSTAGGANDLTLAFEIVRAFDVYGVDGIIDEFAGTTHDVVQSTSGLRGTVPLGNSSANESSTGDVRGYKITATFAGHVNVYADQITVNTNSVNTAGTAFESCAVIFLDENGNPYGTAEYKGFYGDGSPGASTNGGCTAPAPGTPWAISATGVYTMASTATVDQTDVCNTTSGSSGPDDGKDVNAVTDAGLNSTDRIGGFIFMVYLEDVAASGILPGTETTTSTSFTSTLNGVTISSNVLPVELTTFDARAEGKNIMLQWQTASELNNDGFIIEHSTDGKAFSRIGWKEGKGQSFNTNHYDFMHSSAPAGINYYRLRQLDFDGEENLSQIVSAQIKMDAAIRIFPNVISNEITIDRQHLRSGEMTFAIYNSQGILVEEGYLLEDQSESTIELNLSPGQYFIQLQDRNQYYTQPFLKL